jgi:hypothetical protein
VITATKTVERASRAKLIPAFFQLVLGGVNCAGHGSDQGDGRPHNHRIEHRQDVVMPPSPVEPHLPPRKPLQIPEQAQKSSQRRGTECDNPAPLWKVIVIATITPRIGQRSEVIMVRPSRWTLYRPHGHYETTDTLVPETCKSRNQLENIAGPGGSQTFRQSNGYLVSLTINFPGCYRPASFPCVTDSSMRRYGCWCGCWR